jgi:geranylgeranyl diphosphate synthase, type I
MQALLAIKPALDQFILDFLEQAEQKFSDQSLSQAAFAKLKAFTVRGKSVRGGLFLLACQAFNQKKAQKNQADLLQIAAALEIIHAGILIHDDIIDQDELRRGQPSIWQQYQLEAKAKNFQKSNSYGQSLALCLGVIAYYSADLALEEIKQLPIKTRVKIKQHLDQEIIRTYFAEMLDSKLAAQPTDPSEQEVLEMYRDKTARYTFSLPLQLAAMASGLSASQIKILGAIGENLGLIFQIKDDELSLFADEKTSGKSAASDLREGKKTIFYLKLLPKLSPQELEFFKQTFGRADLTAPQIKKLQALFKKHAQPEINKVVAKLTSETKKLTKKLPLGQTLLEEILTFNLSRQN